VFAILLTRGSESPQQSIVSSGWMAGIIVTLAVLGVLVYAIGKSFVIERAAHAQASATVLEIGTALMNKFVLPLEVVGLLLTAALIGAVIIAMKDEARK
jgi:NADH-quinone oxidoreductase subunit J